MLFLLPGELYAQLSRERVIENRDTELTFMAPRNINLYTVQHLSRGELHYSIMHTFGEVRSGPRNLWGLDQGANVRFSFEYGFSDRYSIVVGRSSMDKVIDAGTRISVLRQKTDDSMPVSLSIIPLIGVNSSELGFLDESYTFSDRLHYSLSMPVARKFSDKLSLQVSPIFAHYNRVGNELNLSDPEINNYFSVALSGRYKFSQMSAVSFQYIPALTDAERISDNLAIGIDIETGGHVFQMFFTTSRALHEPYLIASDNGNFFDRGFRFGFNVNRLFRVKNP
jgi:hypothetical protein